MTNRLLTAAIHAPQAIHVLLHVHVTGSDHPLLQERNYKHTRPYHSSTRARAHTHARARARLSIHVHVTGSDHKKMQKEKQTQTQVIARVCCLVPPLCTHSSAEQCSAVQQCAQICRTKGLISEDRSNKATLLLTIPRSLFKSSAKDLSLEILEFDSLSTSAVLLHLGALGRRSEPPPRERPPYSCSPKIIQR